MHILQDIGDSCRGLWKEQDCNWWNKSDKNNNTSL